MSVRPLIVALTIICTIAAHTVSAEPPLESSPDIQTTPGEPSSSQSAALTIEQCIAVLLEQNPDISAAKWNEKAAESRLDTAQRARFPVVTAEGAYQQFTDPQRLIQARYNGELGDFDRTLYRGDVNIRLPLYTGGRISSDIKASESSLESVKGRSTATRDQLVYQAKSIFYSILAYEDLLNSLHFSLKALRQQQKTIEQMMLVRKAAKVDLLRIEVRIANIEQSIVREENTLTILKQTLANLMGMKQSHGLRVQGSLAIQERKFDREELLQKAFAQRPDVRALKSDLQAQAMKVSIAQSEYLPQISFIASYGIRKNSNNNDIKGVRSREDVGYSGISVSIPIFDMKIPSRVSEEKAKTLSLEDQVRKLELQVGLDVETALLDVTSSKERVRATEKAVEQAKESLRIEQQKYSFAKGSITDVLDSQSALLQAETSYYRALADYQIACARLELATGGSL